MTLASCQTMMIRLVLLYSRSAHASCSSSDEMTGRLKKPPTAAGMVRRHHLTAASQAKINDHATKAKSQGTVDVKHN